MDTRLLRSLSRSMIVAWLASAAACRAPDDPASRVSDLERRILAPCCRRQTLEDHESEVARQLRAEIRWRTVAGESSRAIEDDLVRRYGEDIRAMPRGTDPRALLGVGLGSIVGLGALVILRLARRPRSEDAADPAVLGPEDFAYGDRLDDELRDLD
jgi:cytochrome c-type biogenesis protein CcmH